MKINYNYHASSVSKNSIYLWMDRLANLKQTLLIYALCHQFIEQLTSGDELYTKVNKNKAPSESEGWTIVLMERATRFIWELQCGEKDRTLFEGTMQTLSEVIEQTGDLALLTDGSSRSSVRRRRYGNILFEICRDVIRTGRRGRPKNTLKEGVKVRIKNKGQQANKQEPKRDKYQAPHNEHPETDQNLDNEDIHANGKIDSFCCSLSPKGCKVKSVFLALVLGSTRSSMISCW